MADKALKKVAKPVERDKLQLTFDWPMYADATFAGLSILIPIPLLDVGFEWYFRRRMVTAIAKKNGRSLHPRTLEEIHKQRDGCLIGCFAWPIQIVFLFLKRFYRTILYFLTIKDASDLLSYYWHRAFLLDYMMDKGYLDRPHQADRAAQALYDTLADTTTSPLRQLSGQIVEGTKHVWRSLRRVWRKGEEDEMLSETRQQMENRWEAFAEYLIELAQRYEENYASLLTE